MVNTLDLDLRPGSGLGPFELGSSLFDVLAFLRRPSPPVFPSVSVKFDTYHPTVSPIILHLRPHLDLLFTRHTQRLQTISLSLRRNTNSHPPLVLTYKNEVVAGPDVALRRTDVQRIMGPTFKGEGMKYPGVWYSFDEDTPIAGTTGNGANNTDGNTEVKRVVVTQRENEDAGKDDPLDEMALAPVMYGDVKKAVAKVHDGVYLHFYSPDQKAEPIYVQIGVTTAEDLTVELGPPVLTHYKEDDRMAIHATAKDDEESYFYNYFQYGIDFLISGKTHRVRKIILHTNVPGSPLFQRYKRCPWEITLGTKDTSLAVPTPEIKLTPSPSRDSDVSSVRSSGKKKKKKAESTPEPEQARVSFEVQSSRPSMSEDTIAFYDSIDILKNQLGSGSRHSPQPSMQLERTADLPHHELLTLPNATTHLYAFDGVVCEASEVDDVLCVVLF
ncbi:hypothetical protein RhiJN_00645 [Ceratobasidium sp. AG-Ba]|nr:hypothetical protein RhiJN_00645 [Ceratobasidium sp. AG-Ba]QRW01675.1 hypothetical protein RhiLY_00672 [Ceratobasidium sp. AG-Ba]